jgi:Arc/MetJ-type ribon-helix-helix transcriptional regulator
MNITLSPQTEERITEKIRAGDFASAEAMVEHAVKFYLHYEALIDQSDEEPPMEQAEFREVQSAIAEGIQQAAAAAASQNPGISLSEFDLKMRTRYGIQR